ncbi:MAG: bestrophin family ion channel [Myxococcota bacterium]
MALRPTVLRRTAPRVAGYAGWTAAVAVVAIELECDVAMGPLAHSLLGIALGMLLVFRTNAAYDRYWEGRGRWSQIVATARNLMRGWSTSVVGPPKPAFVPLVPAYVSAVGSRLRGVDLASIDGARLRPHELCALAGAQRSTVALARRMSWHIRASVREGGLSDASASTLEGFVAELTQHEAACERIAGSPMPTAYLNQIRHLLTAYIATLPFALVGQIGWLVVPATVVIAFGLIGIQEAGSEIENPFGEDDNDLPLDEYCAAVRSDARAFLGAPGRRAF